MPDEDGYPTDVELATLKELASYHEFTFPNDNERLVEHLKSIWWNPESIRVKRNCKGKAISLELNTVGWSGNEDIIGVLRETDFFSLHWVKSTRGGHYYFTFRKIAKESR